MFYRRCLFYTDLLKHFTVSDLSSKSQNIALCVECNRFFLLSKDPQGESISMFSSQIMVNKKKAGRKNKIYEGRKASKSE